MSKNRETRAQEIWRLVMEEGLSQTEVANLLGVSNSLISRSLKEVRDLEKEKDYVPVRTQIRRFPSSTTLTKVICGQSYRPEDPGVGLVAAILVRALQDLGCSSVLGREAWEWLHGPECERWCCLIGLDAGYVKTLGRHWAHAKGRCYENTESYSGKVSPGVCHA